MADSKITQLPVMTVWSGADKLVLVDTSAGDNKGANLEIFFANIPVNVTTSGQLTVTGNNVTGSYLTISTPEVVSSNNATTQLGAGKQGTIMWDANYLYVATSNTVIKRVALSTFN